MLVRRKEVHKDNKNELELGYSLVQNNIVNHLLFGEKIMSDSKPHFRISNRSSHLTEHAKIYAF